MNFQIGKYGGLYVARLQHNPKLSLSATISYGSPNHHSENPMYTTIDSKYKSDDFSLFQGHFVMASYSSKLVVRRLNCNSSPNMITYGLAPSAASLCTSQDVEVSCSQWEP